MPGGNAHRAVHLWSRWILKPGGNRAEALGTLRSWSWLVLGLSDLDYNTSKEIILVLATDLHHLCWDLSNYRLSDMWAITKQKKKREKFIYYYLNSHFHLLCFCHPSFSCLLRKRKALHLISPVLDKGFVTHAVGEKLTNVKILLFYILPLFFLFFQFLSIR